MANENRASAQTLALIEALCAAPSSFGFFQALRRLECAYAEQPRLGSAQRPSDDPIRLGQQVSLSFAPATLADFRPGKDGVPPLLSVYFLGLFGPQGPLPLHLTDYALQRLNNARDPTLARFADVFHHRILSLFYRAWASSRPTVSFDRPDSDRFGDRVAATIGLGSPSLRDRDAVPDIGKLHYAGHLACQTRHADGLTALLTDFFRLPVALDEFVGHWLMLPDDCRWRLGESPDTGAMGLTATIGGRVWDRQYKFRVVFGPLGIDDFERMLPGGAHLPRLMALVRQYVGDELDWDVNLILKKEEVPRLRLGASSRLGWTAWLSSKTPERDAEDLFLQPMLYAAKFENAELSTPDTLLFDEDGSLMEAAT
ncbi:MAG: type VI secretion system baseplate subunit TssG [Chromatiaceae bacterium]|nr:type VI secretion system baseplate subunit TssG [Chromatiaceae bacterium]